MPKSTKAGSSPSKEKGANKKGSPARGYRKKNALTNTKRRVLEDNLMKSGWIRQREMKRSFSYSRAVPMVGLMHTDFNSKRILRNLYNSLLICALPRQALEGFRKKRTSWHCRKELLIGGVFLYAFLPMNPPPKHVFKQQTSWQNICPAIPQTLIVFPSRSTPKHST
eukprot:scaffold62985_cov46-Attheya_sp.AAC.1